MKNRIVGVIALLTLSTSVAFAQSVTVGMGSASPGGTASVSLTYSPGGNVASFDFRFTFDTVNLTPTPMCNASLAGGGGIACAVVGNEVRVIVSPAIPAAAITGTDIGTIDFAINGAVVPPMTFPLPVTMENYFDTGGMGVASAGSTDGAVMAVTGPTLDSSGPVTLGPLPNGSDNDTFTLTANNPGTVSMISCNTTGDSQIVVTGAVPSTLNMGQMATLTATCTDDSGVMGTMYTATHSCTSDATNSPTTTAISCTTGAGTADPDPNGGDTVNLTVGPVVAGSAGTGSTTFRETNNQGVSYDVSCVISNDGGGGEFTANGALAGTVPAGGSLAISVNGQSNAVDPQPTGQMDCTYSNGATGVVTVILGIATQPEIVPTLSQWSMILMMLAIAGVGFYSMRRRSNDIA